MIKASISAGSCENNCKVWLALQKKPDIISKIVKGKPAEW